MTLVSGLLHQYAQELSGMNGKAIHLCRHPETGEPAYPRELPYVKAKDDAWWEYQIDRGKAASFCAVPAARRVRLKKHICMLKTFWDISSSLRARRFAQMLEEDPPP